ncbi:hypothetical protein LINPERHAP1_LOCUS35317, partial [Linum perenne]
PAPSSFITFRGLPQTEQESLIPNRYHQSNNQNYSSLPPLILPIWLNAKRGLSIQTRSPIEEEKPRKLKHIICDCLTNDGGRMNIPAAAAAARISSCYTLPLVSRSPSRYIASAIPATAFFRNPI